MNFESGNKTTTAALSKRLAGLLLLAADSNLLNFLDHPGTQSAPGVKILPPSEKECNCTTGNNAYL